MTEPNPALVEAIERELPKANIRIDPGGNAANLLSNGYRVNLSGREYEELAYRAAQVADRVWCDADHRLAARYFAAEQEPGLRRDGLPADGIEHLRLTYIRDAAANPEALRELRAWASERDTD